MGLDPSPPPLVPRGMTFSKAVSKLKAQSSNVSFATIKWKETFELWALRELSKMSSHVGLSLPHTIFTNVSKVNSLPTILHAIAHSQKSSQLTKITETHHDKHLSKVSSLMNLLHTIVRWLKSTGIHQNKWNVHLAKRAKSQFATKI